jgi:hypothetical protein
MDAKIRTMLKVPAIAPSASSFFFDVSQVAYDEVYENF